MFPNVGHQLVFMLMTGVLVATSSLIRHGMRRLGFPALVVYFLLGFGLKVLDVAFGWIGPTAVSGVDLLADFGVVVLLFKVGIESNLQELRRQLSRATVIGFWNVFVAGLLGYLVTRYMLGYPLIPALFVGVAMTATSVGIPATLWDEYEALETSTGQLFLDVAELDDLTGVVLMGLLFAVLPVLHGGSGSVWSASAMALGNFVWRGVLFGGTCYLFSLWLEEPMTRFASRVEPESGLMLTVVGTGIVIATLADWLGFSLAIGALFAGLMFSRDPQAVRSEGYLEVIHDLFVPFFFLGIGLHLEPASLVSAMGLGGILLVVAVGGKLVGAGVPAAWQVSGPVGLLMGVTMVPRAEIALIVMKRGSDLGAWAVPDVVYASMVVVSFATCLGVPLVLGPLIQNNRDQLNPSGDGG